MSTEKTFGIQIAMLNTLVMCRIAPSKIHGVGIFAIIDIPKGTKMWLDNIPEVFNLPYQMFDRLCPEVAELLLERWPLIVKGSAFFYPDAKMMAYCNHDPKPNYSNKKDRTKRDIKKGEEITENYKKIAGWRQVYPWIVDQGVV